MYMAHKTAMPTLSLRYKRQSMTAAHLGRQNDVVHRHDSNDVQHEPPSQVLQRNPPGLNDHSAKIILRESSQKIDYNVAPATKRQYAQWYAMSQRDIVNVQLASMC